MVFLFTGRRARQNCPHRYKYDKYLQEKYEKYLQEKYDKYLQGKYEKYLQDVVPARIVLLVTLCLVLINMFNSTTWAQILHIYNIKDPMLT